VRDPLRSGLGVLVAVALLVLGVALGPERVGTTGRAFPSTAGEASAIDNRPAAEAGRPGSFTAGTNFACTSGQRFQALARQVGPFCLPPDTIRAIDEPRFARASEADFLSLNEPVLVVRVGGEARAYPVRILVWHEIVNDTVNGIPVAVTFCPLCNTGVAFERRVDGQTLTFAVSGRLVKANLVMFDRETETLWQQLTGESIRGPLAGKTLDLVPVQMVPFREFLRGAPDASVMTEDTGFHAFYGQDPYAGYGVNRDQPSSFQFGSTADPRLPPKARVLGIVVGRHAAAVPYPTEPGERLLVRLTVGGEEVVVLLEHGAGQPATSGFFDDLDLGWAGVAFLPRVGNRRVSLGLEGGGFVDRESGTIFDLTGRAVTGPLEGRFLERAQSTDSFWFAWAAFYPDTAVVHP
jgi:hypothetical protein